MWQAAKTVNQNVKQRHVVKWLLAQDTHTLHKQARKRLSAEPRVYVQRIDEQWAIDLCDVRNISQHNDDCHFILIAIDILSKRTDAEPVKRKTGKQTSAALKKIFERTPRRPEKSETDQGKEFYNVDFQTLCREEGIHHFSTQSSN